MLSFRLFLGFRVDQQYEEAICRVDPNIVAHFFCSEGEYLQQITKDQARYIGKYVGLKTSLEELQLLETNVYSLLRKVVENYPYEDHSLVLFPVADDDKR